MKRWNLILSILLLILAALCYIFFEVRPITILQDALANKLLCGFIARAGLGLLFGWLLYQYSGRRLMIIDKRTPKHLAWSLPCFMVALVNFPYSAIIMGTASITRIDLLGLYIAYVISIAILEEFIFRGSLFILLYDLLRNARHKPLLITLIGASAFALLHLTNILMGADIPLTLLQSIYTFLIGAMLMVTIMRTKNIWICVLVHAIFDFGGLLIIQIGAGNPWDLVFWTLTITSGVLCAGHIVYSLIKLEKEYASSGLI